MFILILPISIKKNDLYKEVTKLSAEKGISFNFSEYADDSDKSKIGIGYTNYSKESKILEIGISHSSLENEVVFIHELLHAKAHLIGYPTIQFYPLIPIHSFLNEVLQSIQNTLHHLYVYKEMALLNKKQSEINDMFFEFVKGESVKDIQGIGKLATITNLFECYVRDKNVANQVVNTIKDTHQEEIELYNKFINFLEVPLSPINMRIIFIKILKTINDYFKRILNEEVHLNLLIKLDPIFEEKLLSLKASDCLYTIKIQGYPHVFVLDRLYNQCFLFLSRNGNQLEKEFVDELLGIHTVKGFLNALK